MPVIGRGVYGILLTTYDEHDAVDTQDLAAQAAYVAGTAHGIVWPALASEFFLMSVDEIQAGFPAVAAGNRGRVPFVAGVSHLTTRSSVALAEAAARVGADAVIAMAPFMKKASDEQVRRHFQAIAVMGLPIVVQNANWLTGAGVLTAPALRMLAETIPQVQHLKEEAPVLPQTISRILAAAPGAFQYVFGGGGGRFLIDELNRGSAGTMLACEWADAFGTIFDLYERGEVAEARRLHTTMLAGVNLEAAYGMAGAREVLRRRGVIRSTAGRYASRDDEPDAAALVEIEATLEFLAPALRHPSRVTPEH